MKNSIKKRSSQKDIGKTNHPVDRDFQHTEKGIDNITKSEKKFMNKKTREGNTMPDKNKIN